MTELKNQDYGLRCWHYCRHCRSKLAAPVLTDGAAFCSSSCHVRFYHKRCIICEGPMKRNAGSICGKRRCRSVLRRVEVSSKRLR
jgi:hypothetical protein